VHLNEKRTEKWTNKEKTVGKKDMSLIFFYRDVLSGDPAHAGAEPGAFGESGNSAGFFRIVSTLLMSQIFATQHRLQNSRVR